MTPRTCAAKGCNTILSRFNDGPTCHLHAAGDEPLTCMSYHGHTFGCCTSCHVVKPRRAFAKGAEVCLVCSARAQREAEERACPVCGRKKPLTDHYWYFAPRVDGGRRRRGACKECRNARRRERAMTTTPSRRRGAGGDETH